MSVSFLFIPNIIFFLHKTIILLLFMGRGGGGGEGAGMVLWWQDLSPTNVNRGSIPGLVVFMWVVFVVSSLLLSAPRDFSPGTPVFPSPRKPIQIAIRSRMLARLIHEPLARGIRQPPLTLPSLNKLIWFDLKERILDLQTNKAGKLETHELGTWRPSLTRRTILQGTFRIMSRKK